MLPTAAAPSKITIGTESQRVKAKATRIELAKPAIEPSQVFLGLRCGAKGRLPRARPAKYASESLAQISTNTKSRRRGPSLPSAWRRIAYVRGKATSNKPLELIPAEGNASTMGLLVARVMKAIPSIKKNTASSARGKKLWRSQTSRAG